jgi:PAS domain S-box-containing protein
MIERMPGQAVIDLHSVLRGDQPKLETTYSFQSVGLQTLWLRMSVNSLCNSGGEAVILHSDITAFMLFSEKQQKSLALLEGICNQVPGMLYQYRTFADGRHSIPYVNQKITEILGVTPEEALSDAGVVFALIHPEDCNVLGVSLREAAQNRTPWQREFRVVLPDQRWRWLQAESTMEQLDDGGLLWHGFAKDISEQKLLEQELRKAQEDLESQVLERTAKLSVANGKLAKLNEDVLAEIKERLKLERKLRESRDQMVLLAAELNLSEERERRRIATALHDDVVQDLALGKLRLDMTLKEDKPSPVLLEALIALMGKAIQQIRDICHDLSPPLLYDLGLPQAIESLGERLAREHQLGFTLRGKLHAVSLPDHVRTVLYQTARELLINVVKHAKAKHVVVHIRHKHGTVQLSVIDDGVGFAPSMGKGFGLSHVEQRIEFLQGSVRVISGPGRKTVIAVAVPIKPSWRPPS